MSIPKIPLTYKFANAVLSLVGRAPICSQVYVSDYSSGYHSQKILDWVEAIPQTSKGSSYQMHNYQLITGDMAYSTYSKKHAEIQKDSAGNHQIYTHEEAVNKLKEFEEEMAIIIKRNESPWSSISTRSVTAKEHPFSAFRLSLG